MTDPTGEPQTVLDPGRRRPPEAEQTLLEVSLLGDSVRLLRGGPLVVVPTGKLHAVPWGMLPSLRERGIEELRESRIE